MKDKCVIYVRVSSEKQVDGYSLDSQEELCRKRAELLGFQVFKVFREEGISGTTIDRPQLQEMLKSISQAESNIKAVIVYSTSRLNRNTVDYLTLRTLLKQKGVAFYSVTEPTGEKPVEKFIETIFASLNQYQNEERAQNVANSLKKRFLEGHITAKPPLGYLMVKINGKSQAVKDPDTFEAVKTLWIRVRDEQLSLREAAVVLNSLKIKSKHDNRFKKFHHQSVQKILNNKFFMGTLVSQKYGETKGLHEPMIDEQSYWTVQKVLKSRRLENHERHNKLRSDFKLRSIIRCEDCPKKLTSAWTKGHTKKYGYYFCPTRGIHKMRSLDKDDIEPKFIKLLKKLNTSQRRMKWLCEILEEKFNQKLEMINKNTDGVQVEIDKLKETKFTLSEKHLKGIYSDEEFLELKKSLDSQIEEKQQLLTDKVVDKQDITPVLKFMEYYLSHLDIVWNKASLEGKVRIAGSIMPNGIVYGEEDFRTPKLGLGYELTRQLVHTPANWVRRLGLEPRTLSLKG